QIRWYQWFQKETLFYDILMRSNDLFQLFFGEAELLRNHSDQFQLCMCKFTIHQSNINHFLQLFLTLLRILWNQVSVLMSLFQHNIKTIEGDPAVVGNFRKSNLLDFFNPAI